MKLVQPFGSTNYEALVNDALTLSGQVAQRLRARIADGTWSAGATLPAERRLATELGVSRGSLRAGIAQLQAEGLVEARQGSGTRVCADLSQVPLDWMSWVLAHEGLDPKEALVVIEQLVALRRTVALHVLDQAIDALDEVKLGEFRRLVGEQGQYIDEPTRYEALEQQIERFFIALADNRIVSLLNESLRRCFKAKPEVVTAFMGNLEFHHVGNQALLTALQMVVDQPQQKSEIMAGIKQALVAFEIQGLTRVREQVYG